MLSIANIIIKKIHLKSKNPHTHTQTIHMKRKDDQQINLSKSLIDG